MHRTAPVKADDWADTVDTSAQATTSERPAAFVEVAGRSVTVKFVAVKFSVSGLVLFHD
jgi:hypothetical protein